MPQLAPLQASSCAALGARSVSVSAGSGGGGPGAPRRAGTSQVPAVRRLFVERFGEDKLHAAHPLQSVASGLALLAADRAAGRAG